MVILILGILATIVVPRMTGAVAGAKTAKCNANWANLIRALELYAVDNDGAYPATNAAFQSAIVGTAASPTTYFPHGPPECPYDGAPPYVYVPTSGEETVTQHTSGDH